jgi:hypothetical protein
MLVARNAWQSSWPHDPCGALVDVDLARDFAEPITARPLDCTSRGVVAVEGGPLNSRGVCSCGWTGRQHLSSAIAVHDAHLHSAQNRCCPAVPLIARDMSRRAFSFHQFEPSPANRTLRRGNPTWVKNVSHPLPSSEWPAGFPGGSIHPSSYGMRCCGAKTWSPRFPPTDEQTCCTGDPYPVSAQRFRSSPLDGDPEGLRYTFALTTLRKIRGTTIGRVAVRQPVSRI